MLITRKLLRTKLQSVIDGKLTKKELYLWIDKIYFPGKLNFEDMENDNSITSEIMSRLDNSYIDNYSVADYKRFIKILDQPLGNFEKSIKILK